MTVHALTLTNPGAESGSTTGWVEREGSGFAAISVLGVGIYAGTYSFQAGTSSYNRWDQELDVSAYATEIDAGTAGIKGSAYYVTSAGGDDDKGGLYFECYAADGTTLIFDKYNDETEVDNVWTQTLFEEGIPPGTRYIRFGTSNTRLDGSLNSVFWDEFTLELSDDVATDYGWDRIEYVYQLGVYALGIYPAEQARGSQIGVLAAGAAETSNTFHDVLTHQLGIYVLCRPNADRRELRAWTFKQDDHEFYGIQLGSEGTLVWDKLTSQWCQWRSPGYLYWRAEDVCDWEGFNIAGDTESGKLWVIDPTGRLDYDTTPIESRITGYLTHRMRTEVPCFMAELAVSEGQPPTGFDDGSVGITLRTSTEDGSNSVDHGEVVGEGISEDITVRWYGLGLMEEPGMYFDIIDTGYARRIDGLNIEVNEK